MSKIYPFKFLDAYGKEDTHLFFGRDEEIKILYQMIFQTNILLVYGASGTGKTSLVQCGLAGKFQSHEWLSLFIRRGNDINASFEKAIADAGGNDVATAGPDLTGMTQEGEGALTATKILSPLARSFQAIYLRSFCPVYLIFDQFEELFILGKKDEQDKFIETVQEILKLEQPVKMIFSIREEYLGHLYDFEMAVPQLMRKKLRVEPMNQDKVREVIKGVTTFEDSNISLKKGEEKEIAKTIFDKIRKDKSLTIQLPYLQVFLDKLYDKTTHDETHQADAVFTLDTIGKMGDMGDIMRAFLEEQVEELSVKFNTGGKPLATGIIWKILSPFATQEGTKEPITKPELLQRLQGIDSKLVDDTVDAFVNGRILRQSEDGVTYELAHDSLAGQIAGKRTDEDKALDEVKRLIKNQVSIKTGARELFSEKQLNFIDPYLSQLILTEEEASLVKKSRHNVSKNRKIRIIQFAFVILAILITFLCIYSIIQTKTAKEQKKIAEEQSEEARKQTKIAKEQTKIAEFQGKEALRLKAIAEAAKDTAEISEKFALEQRSIAEVQKKIAEEQRRIAEEQKNIADVQRMNALQQSKQATAARDEAKKSEEKAKENEKKAKTSADKALVEEKEAKRLQKLSESKNDAHKVSLLINAEDYTAATALARKIYENNSDNGGNLQDNDIYNALYLCWQRSIYGKQSVSLNNSVRSLAVSKNGAVFAGMERGEVSVMRYDNGTLTVRSTVKLNGELRHISMSPGDKYLLAVLSNKAVLLTPELKVVTTLPFDGAGKSAAFLNEHTFIVQSSTGLTKFEINSARQPGTFHKIANCLAITAGNNGRFFVAAANNIIEYAGWEGIANTPENIYILPSNISCITLDPSGKYLAAGTRTGMIWLRPLTPGSKTTQYSLHRSVVHDLKFHIVEGDHLQLASASGDGTIKLIEVTRANSLDIDNVITLSEHTNWVYALRYSPDGRYLFSGSEDRTAKAWPTSMKQLYDHLSDKK